MRENRPYGSEGGEDLTDLPYPYPAMSQPTVTGEKSTYQLFGCT
jgi:hypothetical protein